MPIEIKYNVTIPHNDVPDTIPLKGDSFDQHIHVNLKDASDELIDEFVSVLKIDMQKKRESLKQITYRGEVTPTRGPKW